MIYDILTVMWKEWREFRDQLFRFKRGGLSALLVLLFLGVITPLQMGPEWLTSQLMLLYWPVLASSMVSTLIADAIAGERERHTLETLLASRLPDGAILGGKVLAAVMYGVLFAVVNLAVGLLVVNIQQFRSGLRFFPFIHFVQMLAMTTLASAFIAGIGVFISLRAATVRQAQQTFGIFMIVLFMAPVLAIQAISNETKFRLAAWVTEVGVASIIWRVLAGLLVLSLVANVLALGRFKRGKLALD